MLGHNLIMTNPSKASCEQGHLLLDQERSVCYRRRVPVRGAAVLLFVARPVGGARPSGTAPRLAKALHGRMLGLAGRPATAQVRPFFGGNAATADGEDELFKRTLCLALPSEISKNHTGNLYNFQYDCTRVM